MAKKKKKKNKMERDEECFNLEGSLLNVSKESRKSLNKRMNNAISEIQDMQLTLYEVDKRANRKKRKSINKKEKKFLEETEALKARQKMAKNWEKTGFLDNMMNLLNNVVPIVKTLAKMLAALIIAFLSIESIQNKISPNTLNKVTRLFNFAMMV